MAVNQLDPVALLQAIVYGPPATMGSKKGFYSKKHNRVFIVDDKQAKLRSFQSELRAAMREDKPEAPVLWPFSLEIHIWLNRPKSHYGTGKNANVLKPNAPGRPTTKPDWDKVARAVCDCGTGIWWKDDSQIVIARVEKHYAEGEERTVVNAEILMR